jgi:cold shock CspA family protein
MISGEVSRFDSGTGLGVARAEDGCEYPFHCTELTDGSRHAEPGAPVRFDVAAGHLGRWEARRVTPRLLA